MPSPRADFTCLGKKCRTPDGESAVYADLPIDSKFCPVCRSKRIQRLYSGYSPGVIRPGMRPIIGLIDQAGAEAQAVANEGKDARLLALKRECPPLAVPIKNVAATLAGLGAGPIALTPGGSKPLMRVPSQAFAPVAGQGPIAGPGSRRDAASEKWLASKYPKAGVPA